MQYTTVIQCKSTLKGALLAVLVCGLAACATSPTGRPQLKLIPDDRIEQMGLQSYQQLKQQTPVSHDTSTNRYVGCVANAITDVVPKDTDWEVTVFDKPDVVNAFALPGGKIGVYTGLLDVTQNQAQLAAVVGHEIGHVLAGHSNARVSANYATQAGLTAVQVLAGGASPAKQQLLGLLGVGAQVGILLPYGRAQESEADLLGLDLMAKAGFDPRDSVQLWRNMSAQGQKKPPELLSTHPSDKHRIDKLQGHMPKALELYRQAAAQGRHPDCS